MSKSLSLLFALLGLFCFLGISEAQQCQVTLESPMPPPVCHYEYINGKKTKVCEAVGSALSTFILNKQQKSQSADFPTAILTFNGSCGCEYILYDKVGLKGAWKKASFSKRSYKKVVVKDVWSKQAKSLKVTCQF